MNNVLGKLVVVLVVGLIFGNISYAEGGCKASRPLKTAAGELAKVRCGTPEAGYVQTLSLQGKALLSDSHLYDGGSSKDWMKWIYTSGSIDEATACPKRLYLVDIGMSPPKVFAFGVKGACNQFDWASWGAKRSVIAIKNNVRFVYEGGQLKAPAKSEKLWLSVEPPHMGSGLSEEDAIPFVEELPLPN